MSTLGKFYGIGVGPGEPGLIPVVALEALKECPVVYAPKARSMAFSLARFCLRGLELPAQDWREVEFDMDTDRAARGAHYRDMAQAMAVELRAGRNVAYLTIGDPFTYSTFSYAHRALLELLPGLVHRTFPGVTSFAAAAAATNWSLGEDKERILILPCPGEMDVLRREIESHDVVVLMKIGDRLAGVLALLREMGIASHCTFARRVGLPDQMIQTNLAVLEPDQTPGYLAVLLIRKTPREKRCL